MHFVCCLCAVAMAQDVKTRVLDAIEAAQCGEARLPTHEQALSELRGGRKRSHWIWYVFPTLQGVRETSKPELILPNFDAARMYLDRPTLASNLRDATRIAT